MDHLPYEYNFCDFELQKDFKKIIDPFIERDKLVVVLKFSKQSRNSMINEASTHGIMFTIEKWAKRLGINLDRDPEQIH